MNSLAVQDGADEFDTGSKNQEHHKNNWFQGRETDVADRKLFMKL